MWLLSSVIIKSSNWTPPKWRLDRNLTWMNLHPFGILNYLGLILISENDYEFFEDSYQRNSHWFFNSISLQLSFCVQISHYVIIFYRVKYRTQDWKSPFLMVIWCAILKNMCKMNAIIKADKSWNTWFWFLGAKFKPFFL